MPRAHALVAFAPAKVNLTLRVLGRREDGYHEIDSIVVFADLRDRLSLVPGDGLALSVRGPTADHSGAIADNLVLKAARAFADRFDGATLGRFDLVKRLPVAAGIGGGSADAAAALRLLAHANGIAIDDQRMLDAAAATGADVPVCLDPRPRVMRGIGDILSAPLSLPKQPAVLVNPGVAVATRDVFAALGLPASLIRSPESRLPQFAAGREALIAQLSERINDLEAPAMQLQPVIGEVLAALRACSGCRLARMSGSGATCFALFASGRAAATAARDLQTREPGWWVRATVLGTG